MRIRKTRLLLAVMITMAAVVLTSPVIPSPVNDARALAQPGLPIELKAVTVDVSMVTRSASLHYIIENRGPDPITRLRFIVAVFGPGPSREIRAFQRVCQNVQLLPGQTKEVAIQLSNLLYRPSTQRVSYVLAVEGANTNRQGWSQRIKTDDYVSAMRTGRSMPAGKVLMSAPLACAEDFCNTCKTDAKELCTNGVKSYSCSTNSTCTCEFECQPNPE